MKDLKHYFGSPKESDASLNDIQTHLSLSNGDNDMLNNDSEEIFSEASLKKGCIKKKRKRKMVENEECCQVSMDDSPCSVFGSKRSRKKSKKASKILQEEDSRRISPGICLQAPCDEHEVVVKRNILRKAKDKSDSDSSKENTVISDGGDNELSTPEPVKNLFNYFNKVDKLPNIEEERRVIKVEAVVHASPEEGLCERVSVPRRKRKSKSKKINVDYDLITVETILESNCEVGVESEKDSEVTAENCAIQEVLEAGHLPPAKGENIVLMNVELTVNLTPLSENDDVNLIVNENPTPKVNREDETIAMNYKENNHTTSDDSQEVIFVEARESEKRRSKPDGTLASFFKFGNRSSAVFPVKKNMKQDTGLTNGVSQPTKRMKTSQPNVGVSAAPFPEHSHILQKDKLNILWNLRSVPFKFGQSDRSVQVPAWSSITERPSPSRTAHVEDSVCSENKAALKLLKKELNLYPIACWYKELKAMRKKSNTECEMWSEVYRPRVSDQFVSNSRSLSLLKAWLSQLKEASTSDGGGSSSEEFQLEGGEEGLKTAALLFGPPGTGKTAGVYAVARELGYYVIEMNASCNRSGRKILNDFSEATRSHKLATAKINFCKLKKKKEDPQRSLLLVEDADLLFADDDGFVATLATLASGSKRPLILVANSSSVRHLAKLSHLFHLSLQFVRPHHDRLEGWLRTLSIVEGAVLPKTEAFRLSLSQDIRRCLLQLQLFNCNLGRAVSEEERGRGCWERCGQCDLREAASRLEAVRALDTLAYLDLVSAAPCEDPCRPYWARSPQPTTLTAEDPGSYTAPLEGLAESLLRPLLTHHQSIPRKDCKVAEEEVDPGPGALTVRRSAAAADLWPALREMARAEQARLATHTKRNARYFNYLSNVGVKGPSSLLHALTSTFSS